jgi:hypothetical protein
MASGIVEMLSGTTEIDIKHEDGDYAELVDNGRIAVRRRDGALIMVVPLSLWDAARDAAVIKASKTAIKQFRHYVNTFRSPRPKQKKAKRRAR